MIDVKIRYNTLCNDNHNYWRILINGEEYICSYIDIRVPMVTTCDNVYDPSRKEMVTKHHISCKSNQIIWDGTEVIVK